MIDLGKHEGDTLNVLTSMERNEISKQNAKEEHKRLAWLKADRDFISKNDSKLNRYLRDQFRQERNDDKARKQKQVHVHNFS